ncbi:hypothetical protein C1645_760663 [Glomus cerebriforme]|uniref:G-protein coupled receptors family 1 profile domain-containing protein n=1 Tax=Glomus cerebriforme TaxID=658196 RepID=A0A397TCP6_9GLOM|nr:hypothetical protein C1645_760663 [Glomus cerebriforme]
MNLQLYSIRTIIFISSFLFIIPINEAYSPSNQTYDLKIDFYIVMSIPLIFNAFNLLGTLYIFYRTFLRWKHDYKSISLSYRFPFYIAITDFLYSSALLINLSYSASNESKLLRNETITWPSPICEVVGFFMTFFVLLNILLVGVISFTTWLRVVKEYYFKFGRFDYKIWLPITLISLVFPLITMHNYGTQEYWCGTRPHTIMLIISPVIIIITLITIIFCYIQVLQTIRVLKDDNSSVTNSYNNYSAQCIEIEKKTFKKVLTYILVFIFQYIPILIYSILKFLKISNIILLALTPSVISIGGIGNVIQYIRNEGLSYTSFSNKKLEEGTDDTISINTLNNSQ